ncbi:unnamed protein product, partial [marine sediment metagenome]
YADTPNALYQVLDGSYGGSNDVCLHIQSEAVHSHRVPDPYLTINSVAPRDNVEQLSITGNLNTLGTSKYSLQVI